MTTKGKKQPSHLDKLLEDKPAEFKAEVLRFAIDSGMRPEDPAFRLVQYIGYLAQLTETAPTDWKQLFEELQGELEDWTELTAEQLKTAADQSETINNLATSCNKLGTALNALDSTSQEQSEQLKNLTEISPILRNVAQEIPTLKKQLANLNQVLTNHQTLTVELSQNQIRELKREMTIYHNTELTLIRREIEELVKHQKKITQQRKQHHSFEMKEIWERSINAVLISICNVDRWIPSIGFLIIVSFSVAIITRATFGITPPPLPEIAQQQIEITHHLLEKTKEQLGYAYVKLQRVENHLGTNSKR
ncbi:MAG: DUF725 domain-containing protein [Richelia sp. RM1_1_1]|nr:DUF725 domain-containing protein [Richelia sp. SM1_7_0]NJN13935.1 DUF725 domain-containing protein [Richelia sp. RM1_1_1]